MSLLYKLKSHPHQTLNNHLLQVKNIAIKTHKSHLDKPEIEEFIEIVCICHDFGKGTKYFQDYLDGHYQGIDKNHGLISSLFTYWMLPDKWKHLGFFIVKKHHGDINNASEECSKDDVLWKFKKQIIDIRENSIEELNEIYKDYLQNKDIEEFLVWINDEKNIKSIKREFIRKKFEIKDMLLCEYVYSLLLTADKSQLIREDVFIPKEPYKSEYVSNYKNNLVKDLLKKKPELKDSDVFKLRSEIYENMVNKLNKVDLEKEKIFSINIPTGTGKTILAYQSAFYIANKIHEKNNDIKPQIIYCLPFTSVIDQNHKVLTEIIDQNHKEKIVSEDLLKFHSVTPIEYDGLKGYDARFCFENWQSKIVSTTFVQLFNTIFKVGKNSIVNRFHRLANSVVVLDEIQAVDEKYYKILEEFIQVLAIEYNCYVILVTATMPMILNPTELIDNKEKYFRNLNRIEIINSSNTEMTLEEFQDIALEDIIKNEEKSLLVVMNTVKSSKKVYEYLKENSNRKILYLSTEIYPKLRLEKIDAIKKSNENYIVVSTQLIEAGVDIDMDIVYRDFSTLDSINQTAGRANRNGIGSKGIVKLFKIVDENGRRFCNYIYPRYLLNVTEEVLEDRKIIQEKDIYDCNLEYFKKVKERLSNDKSNKMLKLVQRLELKKFRDEFELIESDEFIREDIIININEETNSIINKLKEEEKIDKIEIKNLFRKLREYTISVPKKEVQRSINCIDILKYNVKYVNKEEYDKECGIIRKNDIMY